MATTITSISYRVQNQVRYFADYDEIYWNATGNYWAFPIKRARATIELPPGARITATHGYTGPLNGTGAAYTYTQDGDRHIFETTQPLRVNEGLTVAVGFAKGLIDPPSDADRGVLWWHRYGALAILLATLGGLFFFLYRAWMRVGRDPAKGPIFPRYEAPEGYSPAAVHYVYNRGLSGHRALIATLMNLAVKKQITIDASDKKQTVLTRTNQPAPAGFACRRHRARARHLRRQRRQDASAARTIPSSPPRTRISRKSSRANSAMLISAGTSVIR